MPPDERALSLIERLVLRACGGQIVQLPYDEAQREATHSLVVKGLIYRTMEDDQPTAYATPAGDALLASLSDQQQHD